MESDPLIETTVGQLEEALLSLDQIEVKRLLRKNNHPLVPEMYLQSLIVPALERIGLKWEQGQAALSQVYLSGRICEDEVDALFPQSQSDHLVGQARLGIAVLEDYHMLGKRIVYSVLRASGYAVRDYGRKTVEELVSLVQADGIEILLISTLMLPSALRVKELHTRLGALGMSVKVVVGGAPFRFDAQLWQEVQADAMGYNASDVIAILDRFKEESQ